MHKNNIDSKNNIKTKNNIEPNNYTNPKNTKIEKKKNDNIGTESLYNNLDLSEHINKIKIYFVYDLNYFTYKKKLITHIQNDYEKITEIFDDKLNDTLINIYILKKKKKLNEKDFMQFNIYYDFLKMIDNINYMDQEEFLCLIMNFQNIYLLTNKTINFFKTFYFNDLIDYNYMLSKIKSIYQSISKNNIILKTFELLYNLENTDSIKNNIRILARTLTFDYFMYYNSEQMFNKILNELLLINKYIIVSTDYKSGLLKEYFAILEKFRNFKNIFIEEYQKNYKNHISIYNKESEIDIKMKFKFNPNEKIKKLTENLKFIDEIE